MKKVLLMFCGGTIAMEQLEETGGLSVTSKEHTINSLLNMKTLLSAVADIDLEYVINIDSTNFKPDLWEKVGDVIATHYDQYDGIVAIHGTDTMAYTASALSFMVQNLGKPIVFTGAQIPSHAIETDARRNLINAVRFATMDVAGIFLVFDRLILLGARASKTTESGLQAFQSMNAPPVGEIRVNLRVRNTVAHARHEGAIKVCKGFEKNVAVVSLFPGMSPRLLENMLQSGVKGFVLRGYGTGNIPYELLSFFMKAQAAHIPVVVSTQCLEGRTLMQMYDVGQQALHYGAIQAHDMSLECAVTKLMWGLGQGIPYSELRRFMHTNVVGEIDINP